MLLGYTTSGLSQHALFDAVRLVGEIGYGSIAISIDHNTFPFGDNTERIKQVRELLAEFEMQSVIEVDPPYMLDPKMKGEPSLVSAQASDRQRRIDLIRHAIDIAVQLESECVSVDSGRLRDEVDHAVALDRLTESLDQVMSHAAQAEVSIAFEPEPGMFVDTVARYERLMQWSQHPLFRLTLDVGHLYCQGEVPIADYIRRHASRIVNVHLADMQAGVHRHLMFGEGEMDFFPILLSLGENGYQGGLHVQLGRLAAEGPLVAARAFEYLAPLLEQIAAQLSQDG